MYLQARLLQRRMRTDRQRVVLDATRPGARRKLEVGETARAVAGLPWIDVWMMVPGVVHCFTPRDR